MQRQMLKSKIQHATITDRGERNPDQEALL